MHATLRGIVAIGALLAGRVAPGAEPAPNARGAHVHMNMGQPGAAELGATAAFDAKGTLWAAHKTASTVAVSRSSDLGKTWSSPVLVTREPEATDGGADARPKIAAGPGGEIYVTWTRPMSKPYTGEIRFTRSLDAGRTFAPPRTVHTDRQEITHRFDALAVTPSGRVVVAWVDKRDLVAASAAGGKPYRGAAIYFAVSDDRGASFRGDTKLADNTCECCRIALVPRPDGSIIALWRHIFEPNIRDHAIGVITSDAKSGGMERATFDEWALDACPHQGPDLAIDERGQRHAVWFTAAPKASGLFYGRPGANGVAGLRRLGGAGAERADVAALGPRVAIAWKEFDGTRSQLRGLRSEDGGNTWREVGLASTADASDHPQIVTNGHRFFVFWNTRSEPLSVTPFP
jgi:hypothetical protein